MQYFRCFDSVKAEWVVDISSAPDHVDIVLGGAQTPPLKRCKRAGLLEIENGADGPAHEWLTTLADHQKCSPKDVDLEQVSAHLSVWASEIAPEYMVVLMDGPHRGPRGQAVGYYPNGG